MALMCSCLESVYSIQSDPISVYVSTVKRNASESQVLLENLASIVTESD